ncbi:hypothetical protein GPECTOR_16g611 [Gonium pectorale]|uniref:Uncharacterized protein n=1 Tax=Gonium pectorale TaxID=33097 RepID=A0A150GKX1_GONPE|nr:hypothetical protein GPECTOR_16g611 [Gonium pectorale]|eukprot:KXZ50437.1 hypothetical protein GPECTOR_16g611 [Gonium pectorale]
MPMSWTPGDKWTCEVEFAAGQRIEYKYVVLEEQDGSPATPIAVRLARTVARAKLAPHR